MTHPRVQFARVWTTSDDCATPGLEWWAYHQETCLPVGRSRAVTPHGVRRTGAPVTPSHDVTSVHALMTRAAAAAWRFDHDVLSACELWALNAGIGAPLAVFDPADMVWRALPPAPTAHLLPPLLVVVAHLALLTDMLGVRSYRHALITAGMLGERVHAILAAHDPHWHISLTFPDATVRAALDLRSPDSLPLVTMTRKDTDDD